MQNLKEFREAGAKRFQKKEIAAALGSGSTSEPAKVFTDFHGPLLAYV